MKETVGEPLTAHHIRQRRSENGGGRGATGRRAERSGVRAGSGVVATGSHPHPLAISPAAARLTFIGVIARVLPHP